MNIEDFTKQKNLKQFELCNILGVDKRNYNKIKQKPLNIKYAICLANKYNMSLDTIYSEELTTNDIDKELNIKFSLLSEEDKKIILSIIDKILSK